MRKLYLHRGRAGHAKLVLPFAVIDGHKTGDKTILYASCYGHP